MARTGCLSVSTFLGKKWKGDGANPEERSLRDFFEAMVGSRGFERTAAEGVVGCGLCLEELSAETARLLVEQSLTAGGTCLARALQPYLEDLLTRRQGFRGVVDLLAGVVDSNEGLPKVLMEITAKDLFLALLLVTPRRRRVRLALSYASLSNPLPLVFRVASGPGGGGELRTVAGFDVLHELACVPCPGRQLLVNLGTERAACCGKTSLLTTLALTTLADEDLDVRPSGPTHAPSCDLVCTNSERWIVDVHGHWFGAEEAFRSAVLALVLWGGATCLVHCTLADFHLKTGMPRKELAALLVAVGQTGVRGGPDGQGAVAHGRGAVVLVRDTSSEVFNPRQAAIEAALRQFNVLEVIPVDNCRGFRSAARRVGATDRLRTRVEAALQKAAVEGALTPCLEELHSVHRALGEGSSICTALVSATASGAQARRSALGEEFVQLLDSALKSGVVATTLFPLSAISRRLAVLRRVEASARQGDSGAGAWQLEQLRRVEDEAREREAEVSKLEIELARVECSDAMLFFQRVTASREHFNGTAELGLYLEAWKEPKVLPLLKRQRELLDLAGGESPSGRKPTSALSENAQELEEVAARLNEFDFSVDSFWAELELLAKRHDSDAAEGGLPDAEEVLAKARTCWQSSLAGGEPFQVLHGRPLQMAGQFLRGVLEAIGAEHEDQHGIFVVSVIGAQSSAKSTLLNFLFGCGFAVRAGRCTRGLYASYFRPATGGPPMLVLDSEGLLSLGSEGSVFDGQIALMCMTCSHLVLVNNKGELSRQLQDLLEVCLFAMRHLRLARLQPRLVFVLRDQHDRSRTVHEDMLKKMRSHLEEVARTLGTPLHDLILLDGTAVSLLPSAVTSELRQGQEVCWTSELFAREVLQLRSEVFRWLREDAERRAGRGPTPEFSSLAHWYDYAATVWETLDQFGEQLLHYKTIHEIELRRELADVAKVAVRDALDGTMHGEAVDGTGGFHARARQMVDSHVSRMYAAPTRLDLETTDLELSRALACLRDECVSNLEELFQERTSSPRYSATAKEQAKQQIRTPIEWAYENHLYTWKLHLKKASDERAMHELWIHFTGVLNRHLARSGHRSCLSEAESHELFETEWRSYEASFFERAQRITKDWHTLAHEVTLLFNHAVNKLQHEAGALALLKEVGPQQLVMLSEAQREASCITKQTDDEWEEQYFYMGWWGTVKAKGLALMQNLHLSDSSGGTEEVNLRNTVIPRMRQVVAQGLQQFRAEVRNRALLDEATAAEGLRHIAGGVLHEMETRSLGGCSVTLKRPQLLHALHVALRLACTEALVQVESDKQKKAMADLLAQKALVEEHFLLIVQANKGDVERATNFATLYHRSLMNWLDHEVTQLAADIRSQVLHEMPDPQKSSERAFQLSFVARSWPDVLEYVLDMNAYLEKMYLTIFHQKKRTFVGPARSRVEKRVLAAYRMLQEVVSQWGRNETATSHDVTARAPAPQRSVRELKDFISTHAERVPANADSAESHRQLAERLPATADFKIADPKLFADTLQARMGDFTESPEIPKRLNEKVEKALREQSVRAWSLIRGCSERCPLCGSKCDLVGEHTHHHCTHHLFPAFHGWMDRNTGLPSFNHCLCASTREGTYECKDGEWRKLEDYLRSDHPSWLPFSFESGGSREQDVQHLRAAWVNCREPLLEYFAPMADDYPAEWCKECLREGRALTKADLETAKDTIRRLRNRTWLPPEERKTQAHRSEPPVDRL